MREAFYSLINSIGALVDPRGLEETEGDKLNMSDKIEKFVKYLLYSQEGRWLLKLLSNDCGAEITQGVRSHERQDTHAEVNIIDHILSDKQYLLKLRERADRENVKPYI